MRESCLLHQTEAFNDMDKHHTGVLQPATNLILLGWPLSRPVQDVITLIFADPTQAYI